MGVSSNPTMMERLPQDPIAETLARLQASLNGHLAALARDTSVEIVHQTRISIRRLRVALRAMKGQLNPRLRKRYLAELRQFTADLETTREADARELAITELIAHQRNFDQEQTPQLLSLVSERRAESRRDLRTLIQTQPWKERVARLKRYSREPMMLAASDAPLLVIRDVLAAQHRRLRRALRHVGHKPRKLHRLRLLIKETRYLDEDFESLVTMSPDRELQRLHRLQDRLGEFHDNWCLRKWLRSQSNCRSIASGLRHVLDARQEDLLKVIHHACKRLRKAPVVIEIAA